MLPGHLQQLCREADRVRGAFFRVALESWEFSQEERPTTAGNVGGFWVESDG